MPLQSSPASMSLSDIYQNINETDDVMPSGGTNVSLHTLSETMENASTIGPTSRVDISADPRAFSEFYGYHYPGGYSGLGNVLYLGDPTTTTLTNNTLVEGEDLGVYFEHYDQDDGHETVVSIVTNAGVAATGDDTSATFTQDDDEYGDDSIGSVLLTVGSYEGATMKVKVVDDDNAYDSNILSNTFTYRDSVVGHGVTTLTNSVGGSGYTSTTVDASDESVNNVIVTATVTTGTQASATYGVANLVAGDGGTMGASAGAEDWTISNTPGKIRFTSTHNGYGVSVGRNQTTSTADFDVTYARAIDDISRNASTFNSGDVVTISATGEGVSGTHTMRLGYHKTEANDTFTASTDESVLESLYLRQGETENFTLTSTTGTALKTYYPKALYTSGVSARVTGTAFTLAPAYSYSTTGNTTINVSTTQAFAVSSVVGNGSSVAITSSPNIGSGTNSATMTPLLKTGTFTITFTGTANYTQTSNTTDILSVDPTVSLVLTDDTVSTLFPINDAHSDTITSGTHGVSPTTFTHTPTVVGTLQNGNALTYLWTAASSNFTYTSGGTSTVGAVSFKKNSSGTLAHGLTVTGDDDRDDDDENDIVCVSVTKTVSGATSDVFRIGTTFTITSISTAYTQTVALYRFNALDQWVKIAQGVSVASTINFSMTGLGWVADATARPVRLVDDDNTGVYDALGNFAILNPLPTISSFTATASTTIGQINLAWSITGASGGSVNITVNTGADPGSQSTANTDSTTVTGLGNNLTRTYTLTVANANSESVTDADSATTITPTLTFGDPSYDEWDWGDTGDVAIIATKNFADALTGHMGYSLDATATGGTELQTLSSQGAGSTGDITLTFDKNDWNYQSSLGSAITDFRAGNAAASWIVSNNSATVSDFSQPNDATSFAAVGGSATGIVISWTNPTGTYTGVKLYGGVQGDPESLLATVTAGQTPSFSHTSLSQGTTYAYYLQAYYSKTANGVTRTRTNNSTTFTGTTISWDSINVAGLVMLASSGVGWNDSGGGLTSGQEDAHLQATGTTKTLYFLDSTTLGTHTVSMRRSIDGATWNGTNDWYGSSESNDVFYIESDGDVDPANFHLSANVKPDGPADGTATANSSSQITLTWSCTSAIETGFKIFRSTSTYPDSSGTPINSPSANILTYANTGLSGATQYYYSIYSYRGSTVSSVRATATATTWASTTWGSQPFTAPADFEITGIPFQTVTSLAKSITITGADTSSNGTTVSCTNGVKVALSLSSASGYSSYGTSKTITIPNATDILYAKYQHTFTKAGTNPSTSDVTYANGGVNFTDLDILITEEGV